MMRRFAFFWHFLLIAGILFCAGGNGKTPGVKEPESRQIEEGFADQDTMIAKGVGISHGRLKTPLQKEAYAGYLALDDARRQARDMCRALNPESYINRDHNRLAGTPLRASKTNPWKDIKITKKECDPEGQDFKCTVIITIKRPEIQRRCKEGSSPIGISSENRPD